MLNFIEIILPAENKKDKMLITSRDQSSKEKLPRMPMRLLNFLLKANHIQIMFL